ncbi:cysteine protease ATG4 [Geosmithia morbida]|uniref:Cysteine protease n=1 Tax=Geosmithia morbida TaxID=1094350 RepID=A0A9P4YTM2_9HYPO|nr:cysteine protease ATG4 [Geosmithia morbida]KAF4121582.1 cysteine protease ATG4 [Geosmithia morbida]
MENTLASVDLGRYRRIVQMFWDPEPINDPATDQPVWCLGCSYRLVDSKTLRNESVKKAPRSKEEEQQDTTTDPLSEDAAAPQPTSYGTQSESTPSSFSSSLAYGEAVQDGGWPQGFIDDFEARFWMTYRSDFQTIPRSKDPKAPSAMSLSMRIKSQLGDQTGFSSDSGWGCMIRSGQSLLANAIALQRFGRDWRRGALPQEERKLIRLFADDPRAPYSIHNFVRHGAEACGKYPGEWFGPSATARCIQALANPNEPYLKVYATSDGHDVYEDSFMKIARPDGKTFTPTLLLVGTRLGIDKVTPVYWEALIAALQMPHMLIGFLIRSEDDWSIWRRCVNHVQGKAIIHVTDRDPAPQGSDGAEGRHGAIDEVETWSDDDDENLIVSE